MRTTIFLSFLALAACSSNTTPADGGAGDSGPGPSDGAAPDTGVPQDSGPQYKECTSQELAAATLATNGADVSFPGPLDGGPPVYVNNCVRIPVGKDVGWYGPFSTHPMVNHGEPGTVVPNVSSGTMTQRITFTQKGKFSFHCTAHPSTMYGTIQVE